MSIVGVGVYLASGGLVAFALLGGAGLAGFVSGIVMTVTAALLLGSRACR
jgi:hypothetical protein